MEFKINKSQPVEIECSYMKYKSHVIKDPNEVREHLMRKGSLKNYYVCRCHCDVLSLQVLNVFWTKLCAFRITFDFGSTQRYKLPSEKFFDMLSVVNNLLYPDCKTYT